MPCRIRSILKRYILGGIDQNTLSMSLRIDFILTPELTIQFWGQPFLACGDYSDFNIKEFLSNLVLRWEYRPESFLYLVWSQSRSGSDSNGELNLADDFYDIWEIYPRDVVLLKASFRIGR